MHWFLEFIFGIKLYMFRTVPLSIIRSFSLRTQQWYISCRFADSCEHNQDRTPSWQRNWPKHVEFYSKNKFEKLVYLVGFITRIYHVARSRERKKSGCVVLLILMTASTALSSYRNVDAYILTHMCNLCQPRYSMRWTILVRTIHA